MKPFTIEDGEYGKRLVAQATWSPQMEEVLLRRGVDELELNEAKGWPDDDVSFLSGLPFLRGLTITNWTIKSISAVNDLHELRVLSVHTYCNTEIDFSNFPKLEDCYFEYLARHPKAKSIFACKSLKHLYLNYYKGRDTEPFSALTNLESLRIGNGPVRSLEGLSPLTNLRMLGLYYLTKLESLKGIEDLTNLRRLEIGTCSKLQHIEEVHPLKNLEILMLDNCKDIASLSPLKGLEKLAEVHFIESTNIVDGDLSMLTTLKPPALVAFQNRKHYSHRREEINPSMWSGKTLTELLSES